MSQGERIVLLCAAVAGATWGHHAWQSDALAATPRAITAPLNNSHNANWGATTSYNTPAETALAFAVSSVVPTPAIEPMSFENVIDWDAKPAGTTGPQIKFLSGVAA